MMVVYSERARADIAAIFDHIATDNHRAAMRVENSIRTACEGLARYPRAGVPTDEPNIRRRPLVRYPYTIFYRINEAQQRVEIARVVHAARVRSLGQLPSEE